MIDTPLNDRIVFDFFCVGCSIFELIRWTDANEKTNPEFQHFARSLKSNQPFTELNIWANYSSSLREFVQLTLVILIQNKVGY